MKVNRNTQTHIMLCSIFSVVQKTQTHIYDLDKQNHALVRSDSDGDGDEKDNDGGISYTR